MFIDIIAFSLYFGAHIFSFFESQIFVWDLKNPLGFQCSACDGMILDLDRDSGSSRCELCGVGKGDFKLRTSVSSSVKWG